MVNFFGDIDSNCFLLNKEYKRKKFIFVCEKKLNKRGIMLAYYFVSIDYK